MTDARSRFRELVRHHVRDYAGPASSNVWSCELEMMPREQLEAMQLEKAAAAYDVLFEHSPFYRRKFEAAGLGPGALKSAEDLRRIPITRPVEWVLDQEQNPPWGSFSPLSEEDWVERGWMIFTTSGTKAAFPRVFRHTSFDREMWTWHGARALYAMGVRRGDVVLSCFAYGTSVAFWGLHYALNHMGIPVIPGGGATSERRALFIERYKPTVIMSTPSYALVLGREMAEMGLSPAASSVKRLVCAGEPGACVPATKRRLEELWGAQVHDDFGCTEVAMSPLGYTCTEQVERTDGVDVHLMEDQYLVEVLDPVSLEPVPPGARGMLVVSNLFSEAQPILRYAVGDWISVTVAPCGCGRTHARAIGGLHGRSDEMIKVKGLKFFPSALEDAVRSQSSLGDEFVIELTTVADRDVITITVEPASAAALLDPLRIAKSIRGALGIDVRVVAVAHGFLPRTAIKAKRLFDRRTG